MTSTKKSLLVSTVALLLCFVMLVGSTFAWFTDVAVSKGNVIQSGNLDIALMKGVKTDSGWNWIENNGEAIFDYDKWEPGYTTTAVLAIENHGSLNATWTAKIKLNGTPTILGDVIDVYVTSYHNYSTDRPDFKDGTWQKLGTVSDILNNDGMLLEGGLIEPGHRQPILVALNMRENAGNEYQGIDLGANFDILVLATQATGESDSFDDKYDENAAADFFPGFQGGSASASVALNDQGATVGETTMDGGDVSAVIPAGVLLANGTNTLNLAVTMKNSSDANVQLNESEKMHSLDVHIEGVAQGNTVPMLVTLKGYLTTGINTGALKLYHVENGATVVMTQVQNPTNHNEFSYDPSTGDVTLALASFSEVAVVTDTNNPWDGKTFNYLWYDASASEFTIYNADQLAGFGAIVDGKAQGIAQDSFAGKTVKLNNNIYLSGELFDPIGWGYVNASHNRDVDGNGEGDAGKVFQGTFDGGEYDENGKLVGRYTIFDLYQNGWDLEDPNQDGSQDADYTYTNCGFGLFAAASGATFKNLTISGAYVRVECVETGILVGLSQNSCTYDNIQIHNSKIANYQRPTGGLIGEVSGSGTTKITNVTIGSDVVVGSLWGDFDAPCGGVIGAYWNDIDANPQIEMTDVEVGCRMDVYSDVTSAYQWYAYRRAGMLIGNTDYSEKNENGTNIASTKINGTNYLTCSNVKVYYGDWAAYHYCQFTNQDNSWCNNYPWVRVEEGENCSPYSNPRYGQPVVGGVTVSTDNHTCTGEHLMERRFNQLYGGGQGVYGQFKHEGVEVINYRYSITYVNDYQVLAIKYVTESGEVNTANDVAQKLVEDWAEDNITGTWKFGGWMNAGSTKMSKISADNDKDIVLYPYFNKPYTARFVDSYGNVVAWCLFHAEDLKKLEPTEATARAALPGLGEDFDFDYWEVHVTDDEGKTISTTKYTEFDFSKATTDVTIYPVYEFNGDVTLIPIDSDGDGEINHYQVAGYKDDVGSTIVEIPAYVNGKPVTTINADAFSSYDDLHSVIIPGTITQINSQSFTADNPNQWGTQRDTITMYFDGDPAIWSAAMEKYNSRDFNGNCLLKQNWDNCMGESSCVFFLDENGKVDLSKGYWELTDTSAWYQSAKYEWLFHNHAYGSNSGCNNEHNNKTDYTADCKCDIGTHTRPDRDYWINDDGTPITAQ